MNNYSDEVYEADYFFEDMLGHADDEIFDKYCLAFYDMDFDYTNIYEFVCDFDLEKMEFYGELFTTFLANMKDLTDERLQAIVDMDMDAEWVEDALQNNKGTNELFQYILNEIIRQQDEEWQDRFIYQIFGEVVYDEEDILKVRKELFNY